MAFFNPDVAVDAIEKIHKQFLCQNCRAVIPLGMIYDEEDNQYIYIRCIDCGQLCRISKSLIPK